MDQPLQTVGASYRELAYMRHGWGPLQSKKVTPIRASCKQARDSWPRLFVTVDPSGLSVRVLSEIHPREWRKPAPYLRWKDE